MIYNILIPYESMGTELAIAIKEKLVDHDTELLLIEGNGYKAIDNKGLDKYTYFLMVLNRKASWDEDKNKVVYTKQYSTSYQNSKSMWPSLKKRFNHWTFVGISTSVQRRIFL